MSLVELARYGTRVEADLARLELAARFLAEGYERAVWIDADVLVFDPQRFEINVNNSFTVSREVCLYLEDGWCIERGVNNSVAVFQRENTFLRFFERVQINISGINNTAI